MGKTCRRTRTVQATLAIFAMAAPGGYAFAAPRTLDCVLTNIEIRSVTARFESRVGAEKRSIAVIFDDDAKTLIIKEGGAETRLGKVAISQTSMTGAAGNISLGIDRSSWGIVFQTYGQDSTRNEFGECRLLR